MNATQETILAVPDMTCGSCVRHVGDALRRLPGVAGVAVDRRAKAARVRHDPGVVSVSGLVAALHEAGYMSSAA